MVVLEAVPSPGTLALNAAIGAATALIFFYVGALMLRRQAETAGARRALATFATWWFSLAVLTAAGAVQLALAAAGVRDNLPYYALGFLAVVPLVIALWALLYYLLYIYVGNERFFWPLTLSYAGVLAWFGYLVWWLEPIGVTADNWTVSIDYAKAAQLEGTWLGFAVTAVLLGPTIVAALLYGSLFFRAEDRGARYRIAMVSSAFLLWFASPLVATAANVTHSDWWPPASRVIALVATFMVLAAYKPPGFVRRRYRIPDVTTDAEGDASTARPSQLGRATFAFARYARA